MSRHLTTTERGYGHRHQTLRARWAPRVATGTVTCWRCEQLIAAGEPWDLGHDDQDRTKYRGPEHRDCNQRRLPRPPGSHDVERFWIHPNQAEAQS